MPMFPVSLSEQALKYKKKDLALKVCSGTVAGLPRNHWPDWCGKRSQLRGGSNWRTGADEARQIASSFEAERFERSPDRRAVDD